MNPDETVDALLIFERLQEFSEAYARKDVLAVLSTFTRGCATPVVVAGDSTRPLVGTKALCQRLVQEFSMPIDFRLRTRWLEFDISGDVAWVAVWSEAIIQGEEKPAPTRLTAILNKERRGWFISQLHFSIPLSPACDLRQPPTLQSTRHSNFQLN